MPASTSPTRTYDSQVLREEERIADNHQVDVHGEVIEGDEDDFNIYRSNALPIMATDTPWSTARRPVVSNTGIQVNWAIRAHPLARPDDVLDHLMVRFSILDRPRFQPEDVLVWWRVDEVVLAPPIQVPDNVHDLRRGLWEQHQSIRTVPIVCADVIVRDIAITTAVGPQEVVRRVEALQLRPPRVHIVILEQIWFICLTHRDPCPHVLKQRGGMHGWRQTPRPQYAHGQEREQDIQREHDILDGYQIHDRDFVQNDHIEGERPSQFVMACLPPAPPRQILLRVYADQNDQEIAQQAADRFARDPQQVRVLGAVPTEAMIRGDTLLLPLKVRLPNMPDAPAYKTASIQWGGGGRAHSEVWTRLPAHWAARHLLDAIVAVNELQQFHATLFVDDEEVEPEVVFAQYPHWPVHLKVKVHDPTASILQDRGGARHRRQTHSAEDTRRTTMQGWASQRILDHADIEPCIAHVLVRAEQRTVSAVLAARSPAQLLHVVKAALHRNGYGEAARRVSRQIPSRHARVDRSSSPSQQRRDESSASPDERQRHAHEEQRGRTSREVQHGRPQRQPEVQPQQQQRAPPLQPLLPADSQPQFIHVPIHSLTGLGEMVVSQQAAIAMLAQQMADMHAGQLQVLRQLGEAVDRVTQSVRDMHAALLQQQQQEQNLDAQQAQQQQPDQQQEPPETPTPRYPSAATTPLGEEPAYSTPPRPVPSLNLDGAFDLTSPEPSVAVEGGLLERFQQASARRQRRLDDQETGTALCPFRVQ